MGRARAGTIRSPLWRSGGVTFAASKQDFSQKINKKMYRLAIRSICSELLRQNRFIVLESFELETAKTRDLLAKLSEFKIEQKVLIVLEEVNETIYLAARNLPNVELMDVEAINPLNSFSKDINNGGGTKTN